MKGTVAAISLAAASLLALGACAPGSSGAGTSDGDAGYSLLNCPGNPQGPTPIHEFAPVCASCLLSNCAAGISRINRACNACIQCVCPLGADVVACSSSADGSIIDGGCFGDDDCINTLDDFVVCQSSCDVCRQGSN